MNIAKTPMDYDAQYDSDTLTRAAEIKKDKPRHARALKHTAKKAKALSAVLKEGDGMRLGFGYTKKDPYPSVANAKTF